MIRVAGKQNRLGGAQRIFYPHGHAGDLNSKPEH